MTSGRFGFGAWSPGAAGGQAAGRTGAVQPQAFDIFPTRIWQARLRTLSPRFPEWVAVVEGMRAAAPEPAGRTNRGGWNSVDQAVLEAEVFAELEAAVVDGCRFAFGEMGRPDEAVRLQSWINIHDRGGFNFQHMHDGCLLSGCFYLQVPEGSGDLVLRDPRPGVVNGFSKGPIANGYRDIKLKPEAGLLVLFPHWLEHFVEVHDSDTSRICIPFNAIR